MKNVKLKVAALLDDRNHAPGDVVSLTDERASALVKAGHAEPHDDDAEPANPGTNPLADGIQPCPPGGATFNPVDALSPVVADNPGLVALAKAGAATSASRKVAPVPTRSKGPAQVGPDTTAAEVEPHPAEGPKPEGPKPEGPKPEGPKPEGPKPEGPKPEARRAETATVAPAAETAATATGKAH